MVDGLVVDPIALNASDLAAGHETEALLDCTSGWYTVKVGRDPRRRPPRRGRRGSRPRGNPGADSDREPAYVRFTSVTGYRWSLPIEEAEDAAARNARGRRAPLARARRARSAGRARQAGFQWVKWVTRVEVRSEYDLGQWVVTLVSGFE